MPIKLNFKRTHRYNVAAKDLFVIRIFTLDGTCVEYTVSSTTTGRDALEYVAQRLDIEEICVFGLKYEDWSGDFRWLFLNESVKKQLDKHARQHALTLSIMLFIDNPQFISDAQLRRFFYLQLRQDVATGALPVTLKLGIKLSAYSLQADFGDFVDVETTLSNWRDRVALTEGQLCGAFDLSTTEYVDDILWGYVHLQGVSRDNAIWYFLDEIRHIPRYGVRTFRGMTCRNEPAELGVSRNGITIMTLEPQQRTTANLKWEHIKDLTYSRKTFTIQMLKKNKSVHFVFEDTENARYLWQFCIQMHSSYIDYWTRIKSSPQQPAIHISEPPDILRGTELRYTNPDSPLLHELYPDGSNSSLVPNLVGLNQATRELCGSAPLHSVAQSLQQRQNFYPTSQGLLRPSGSSEHQNGDFVPDMLHSEEAPDGHRPFRIDLNQTKSPVMNGDSNQGISNVQKDELNLAILSAIREGTVDSETGTLVGQWSLRSGADTLDSQMINQGCVTCLPGRDWLRPAGWFQPRAGVNNNGLDGTKTKSKPSSESPAEKLDGTKSHNAKRSKSHHHRRHHQPQTPSVKRPEQTERSHRNHSERHTRHPELGHPLEEHKQRAASSSQARESGPLPMRSVAGVLIGTAPSSPSSLVSSDSSSDHGIVASRASFSSSSSSCSESAKKPAITCDSGDESCSSTSSSTSSINSNPEGEEFDENGVKKSTFRFPAALCSAAQNVSYKPNSKAAPLVSVSTVGTNRSINTGTTARKLWLPNVGPLRPLLAGFNQHHYRPQVEMKRQQAAVDAVLNEQNHMDTAGNRMSHKQLTTSGKRTNQSRDPKLHSHKPLHEFQRWLLEAKHRLPTVWNHTVAARGMTLQISPPLGGSDSQGGKTNDIQMNNRVLKSSGPPSLGTTQQCGNHQLAVLPTVQPGRLARSSSEACARQLSELHRIRFGDASTFMLNNKRPAIVYPDTSIGLGGGKNGTGSMTHINACNITPTIQLFPPSPTQTPFSQHSPSPPSDGIVPDPLWPGTVTTDESRSCGTTGSSTPRKELHSSQDRLPAQTFQHIGPNRLGSPPEREQSDGQLVSSANQLQRASPLQRQGAFRASPGWRLFPCPLKLNDAHRLAVTPPRQCPEKLVDGSGHIFGRHRTPTAMEQKASSSPAEQFDSGQSSTTVTIMMKQAFGQIYQKTDLERLAHEDDTPTNGNNSAPPTTPSGRLHFVWDDLYLPSNTNPLTKHNIAYANAILPEWDRENGPRTSTGINLSHFLASQPTAGPPDVALTGCEAQETIPGVVPSHTLEGQLLNEAHQPVDSTQPFNSVLTTSSSSEQSSSQRPPSNGPLHLLTHSDIHQLLSLTNIKETELAHRLLAEYRLALLQQQSLHTNSVSTPNLTASQELQMFSSSTAAEEIEDVDVCEQVAQGLEPEEKRKQRQHKSQKKTSKHTTTNEEDTKSHSPERRPKRPHHSHHRQSSRRSTSKKRAQHGSTTNKRSEHHAVDSPDYVNAAAFRNERRACDDRPLSLASSTDMESNGTFRVLSSMDTRTSSGAGCSMGNLTGPGLSFGSMEGAGASIDGSNGTGLLDAFSTSNSVWDPVSQRALDLVRSNNGGRIIGPVPEVNESSITQHTGDWLGQCPPDLCMEVMQAETHQSPSDNRSQMLSLSKDLSLYAPRTKGLKRSSPGEYENLETLSDGNLELLRLGQTTNAESGWTLGKQPVDRCVADLQQISQPSESVGGPGNPVLEPTHGSLSTLAYSTTSVPHSPSSSSRASSALSSSSSSSSSSSVSSTSRSLSELPQTIGHEAVLPQTRHRTNLKSTHCSPIMQSYKHVEHRHSGEQHSTCCSSPCSKENDFQMFSKPCCPKATKTSATLSRLPQQLHRDHYPCSCTCHGKSPPKTLIKSNSLRMNSPKNHSSQINLMLSPCERVFARQKARSFDPFSGTSLIRSSNRRRTPVQLVPYLSTSQAIRTCRKTSKNVPECLRGWRPRRSKSRGALAKLAVTSEQGARFSYSDDDATEMDVCCLSDAEEHCHGGHTSATLSPVQSPVLSSASSYSFSTSSLDVAAEEFYALHHHHHPRVQHQQRLQHRSPHHRVHSPWCMNACTTVQAHRPERNRRGGSLDPSVSNSNLAGSLTKQTSPVSLLLRNAHRKGNSEQTNRALPSHICPYRHVYEPRGCSACETFSTATVTCNLPRHNRHSHTQPQHRNPNSEKASGSPRAYQRPRRTQKSKGRKTTPPAVSVNPVRHRHHQFADKSCKTEQPTGGKPPVARKTSTDLPEATQKEGTRSTTRQGKESPPKGAIIRDPRVKPPRPRDLSFLPQQEDRQAGVFKPKTSPNVGLKAPTSSEIGSQELKSSSSKEGLSNRLDRQNPSPDWRDKGQNKTPTSPDLVKQPSTRYSPIERQPTVSRLGQPVSPAFPVRLGNTSEVHPMQQNQQHQSPNQPKAIGYFTSEHGNHLHDKTSSTENKARSPGSVAFRQTQLSNSSPTQLSPSSSTVLGSKTFSGCSTQKVTCTSSTLRDSSVKNSTPPKNVTKFFIKPYAADQASSSQLPRSGSLEPTNSGQQRGSGTSPGQIKTPGPNWNSSPRSGSGIPENRYHIRPVSSLISKFSQNSSGTAFTTGTSPSVPKLTNSPSESNGNQRSARPFYTMSPGPN